ncbi:MAG: 3-deoxy-manno-octulosonate cytidylyltransferase [Candidatus Neomarinimicrobiota bacterium]
MKVLGIIPARYAATRLPGKPLVLLKGKTLIQRVYENARNCQSIEQLIVATDDQRIYDHVKSFGGECRLTPAGLPSGTDRCTFVARDCDAAIIVNIQGDEPFLPSEIIDQTVQCLQDDPALPVGTAARIDITETELNDPNVVKVLVNIRDEALYFSRLNIPYLRDQSEQIATHPALAHIGLYVYRADFLQKFTRLPVSVLERMEKLEQLRILENGYRIKVVRTAQKSLGIDTQADLDQAIKYLEKHEI